MNQIKFSRVARRGAAVVGGLALLSSANALSINEIRIDQSGADDDEFVELYSPIAASLDGVSFISLQDNGFIDDAINLTGFGIGAGGFFLIGESTPLPSTGAIPDLEISINLENGENSSYLLVSAFSGIVGTDLDADDDGIFDGPAPWATLIDGIAFLDDDLSILDGGTEDIDYSAALGIPTLGPDGTFYPAGGFASVDGGVIDSISSFSDPSLDTPGATNVPEPSTYALIGGLLALGFVVVRRRK